MNKQKTVATLQIRYFEEACQNAILDRQNVLLRSLLREARACVQVMSRREPTIAVWASEWLTRVSALVDQEAPK